MSATVATRELPIIDFAALDGSGVGEVAIARELDATFSRTGFCYFRNIGIDDALVRGLFDASRRFHALPGEAKRALAMNEFHRGYMAPNTSLIVTSSVAQ